MFNYEALSLVMEGKIISETAYFISLLLFKTSECGIILDRKAISTINLPYPLHFSRLESKKLFF